jgi:hypothetical protein
VAIDGICRCVKFIGVHGEMMQTVLRPGKRGAESHEDPDRRKDGRSA